LDDVRRLPFLESFLLFAEFDYRAVVAVSVGSLNWKASGRTYQLVAVLGSLAWIFLTRPLAAMALGAPIVLCVFVAARQRQLIRQVVFAMAIALPVLLLYFLWQERTVGDWMISPWAEYSRTYFPFDKPGFGVDPTRRSAKS
jgi:4-amino-4-deoxy-L-arabinose transferase-like glycosyltransferase